MTGFIRGVAKIGGGLISHGDEAADVAKAGGAAAKIGEEAVEQGIKQGAGRKAAGMAGKGFGKTAAAIADHPIRSAKAGLAGLAAWEFGPELMAIGKKAHGVADAMTGPFLDEKGDLNGLGTAGMGVGALGLGALAIKKLKGDDHEIDPNQRPSMDAIGGGAMQAYDPAAIAQAQEAYKKDHDFIPFNGS